MIYVRIKGGFGNQLFCYAMGRALAQKYGAELRLDLGWFKDNPYRLYELDKLNTRGTKVGSLREQIGLLQLRGPKTKAEHLVRFLPKLLPAITYVREEHLYFEKEILNSPDNIYLDGDWQSEKYFSDIAPDIRKEFTLKYPSEFSLKTVEKMRSVNSVSLHVRRGDYANNPKVLKTHGLASLKYYRSAIDYISARVENPLFFVFSDDLPWVKENLALPVGTFFIGHPEKKDYEEPFLMASCRHQIVANSTFSWWGAWLNPNPEKIIIAPKIWFLDPSSTPKDLVPSHWVRL